MLCPGRVLVLDTDAGGGIRPEAQRVHLDDLHERVLDVAPNIDERFACGLYAYLFLDTSAWSEADYRSLRPLCATLDPRKVGPDPFSE